MVYKNDGVQMDTKELLTAYHVITTIMKNNKLNCDSSWRHVQCWLSNKICDQLDEGQIIQTLETFNNV